MRIHQQWNRYPILTGLPLHTVGGKFLPLLESRGVGPFVVYLPDSSRNRDVCLAAWVAEAAIKQGN